MALFDPAVSTCFAQYTITDLGPLSPTGINAWGQVVGDLNGHAYMWSKFEGLKDLGLLPGGTFSSAAAINDLGVVTGTADGPGTVTSRWPDLPNNREQIVGDTSAFFLGDLSHAAIWNNGVITDLGALAGPDEEWRYCSGANSINDLSQVVGFPRLLPLRLLTHAGVCMICKQPVMRCSGDRIQECRILEPCRATQQVWHPK